MAEFQPEFNPGGVLAGQQYDPRKNIAHPFLQEMLPQSSDPTTNDRVTGNEGNVGAELTPQDANQTLQRQYNISAIQAAILALKYSWFSYSSLPLPDTLTGIDILYSSQFGNGASSHPSSQMAATFVGGGTISINPRSHAQASASIIPDIEPLVKSVWTQELPTMNYAFYVIGNNTLEAILARVTQIINPTPTTVTISHASPGVVSGLALTNGQTVLLSVTGGALPAPLVTTQVYYVVSASGTTFELALTKGGAAINTTTVGSGTFVAVAAVQPLPVFQTAYYTVTAIGKQVSISADADSIATLNSSFDGSSRGASYAWGNGNSIETGLTIRTLRIGPVINAAITPSIIGATSQTVTATVTANTVALVLNGTTEVPAITNSPTATSQTVTGSVSFSSLSATSVPAIPTSGLYLTACPTEIDEYGALLVRASVVNFAIFA